MNFGDIIREHALATAREDVIRLATATSDLWILTAAIEALNGGDVPLDAARSVLAAYRAGAGPDEMHQVMTVLARAVDAAPKGGDQR